MIHRPRSKACASLAALTLLAAAPLAAPHLGLSTNYLFDWPYAGSLPDFEHAEQGLLENDDALPEFAFLGDGTIYVMDSPGQQIYFDTLSGVVATAFAIEHRSGAADRLIVSTSSGLYAYAWSSSTNHYALDATLSTASTYQSLAGIQLSDPVSGTVYLTALQSDGSTLRSASLSGNTLTSLASFQPSSAILDWRALDWDGTSGQEIAVQTSSGIRVHEGDGTQVLGPLSVTSTNPCLWSFHDSALGADRLVASIDSGTGYLVYVLDNRYPSLEPSMRFNYVPDAFELADLHGDSEPELVVSFTDTLISYAYRGRTSPSFPTQSTFDVTIGTAIGMGPPSGVGSTYLATADFDLDGDLDVMAAEDGRGIWMHRSNVRNELASMLVGPSQVGDVTLTPNESDEILEFPVDQPPQGDVHGYKVEIFDAEFVAVNEQVTITWFDPDAIFEDSYVFGTTPPEDVSATLAGYTWDSDDVLLIRLTPLDSNGDQDGAAMTFDFAPSGPGSAGGTPGYPPGHGPGPCTSGC